MDSSETIVVYDVKVCKFMWSLSGMGERKFVGMVQVT